MMMNNNNGMMFNNNGMYGGPNAVFVNRNDGVAEVMRVQMLRQNLGKYVLPAPIPGTRRVEIALAGFEEQTTENIVFKHSSEDGLSREEFELLNRMLQAKILDYQRSLKTGSNCATAALCLLILVPIAIPLIITSKVKLQTAAQNLLNTISSVQAIIDQISASGLRSNGAQLLVGLDAATFNASFAAPGVMDTNIYCQKVRIVMDLPRNNLTSIPQTSANIPMADLVIEKADIILE